MVISKKKIIASALAMTMATTMAASITASAAAPTGIAEDNSYSVSLGSGSGNYVTRYVVASAPKVGSIVYDGTANGRYKVTKATTSNNVITLNTQNTKTQKTKTFTVEKGIKRNFVVGTAVHKAGASKAKFFLSLRGNSASSATIPQITSADLTRNGAVYSVTFGKKIAKYSGTVNIKAYNSSNALKTYKVRVTYWEEYSDEIANVPATSYNGYTKAALVGNSKATLKDKAIDKLGTDSGVTRWITIE